MAILHEVRPGYVGRASAAENHEAREERAAGERPAAGASLALVPVRVDDALQPRAKTAS